MHLEGSHIQNMSAWDIRRARLGDAPRIGALSKQLGYTVEAEEVKERLRSILGRDHHAILIAETAQGQILGWIHLFERPLIIQVEGAELGGLVVDADYRRRGIGKALIQAAEAWVKGRNLRHLTIRSNTTRTSAKDFYEALGYEITKNSNTFRKPFEAPK